MLVYLLSDLEGLFSCALFPLKCEAWDVTPQRAQPWGCTGSLWIVLPEPFGVVSFSDDFSVKLSAPADVTPDSQVPLIAGSCSVVFHNILGYNLFHNLMQLDPGPFAGVVFEASL